MPFTSVPTATRSAPRDNPLIYVNLPIFALPRRDVLVAVLHQSPRRPVERGDGGWVASFTLIAGEPISQQVLDDFFGGSRQPVLNRFQAYPKVQQRDAVEHASPRVLVPHRW